MSDSVNSPTHYNQGSVETIDGIRAALGEGFADYCKGNVIKYVWRCGLKGDSVEDLRKAAKYLEWAIEAMQGNCPVMPDSSSSKPIAIPSGWRELEPDEVPVSTDMHEWMGGWYYRNDDATHEYCWFSNRHIRKIEADETKPIEIPEGWRELKPDEVPLATDMHEWMGGWYYRNDESTHEYKLHSSRHIRKIEAGEPKPIEIPDGYRELQVGEMRSKTDLYLSEGYWETYGDFDPAGSQSPKYDKAIHRKQIRKIEAANTSVTPNSSMPSEWIPKVGDKVRVYASGRAVNGFECVVEGKYSEGYVVRSIYGGFRSTGIEARDLQLIEAAP